MVHLRRTIESRLPLPEEVGRLAKFWNYRIEITQTYRTSILMEGYVAQKGQTEYNRLESCSTASYITNMNFLPIENGYTAGFQEKKAMVGNSIASGIIKLYSILNPMLCLIAIVGFFLTLISLFST